MEMVERVARALAAEIGTIWGGPLGEDDPSFLPYKARYMSMARAAIEAMRTPTEAQLAAFHNSCDSNGQCLVKYGYTVMIDAALGGGK